MLCWSSGRSLLRRALGLHMYATRLYGASAGGGGGGGTVGGVKQGRRSLAVMEAPPPPHHPHMAPPPPAYQLYQGRPPDAHRGAHYHYHHHAHLAPPPLPPHYQHHPHFHAYGGGALPASAPGGRKKAWNFIHEKMSYDTFFTMKRLIERSRRPDEVLRWVTQNPAKVSHNHYAVALQKIGQLLQATPPPRPPADQPEAGGGGGGEAREEGQDRQHILDHPDFQTLCGAIVSDCAKFDNFSIVNCLYAVAALGLSSDSQVVQVLEAESQSRLNQFNQKDVSMVFSSSMKQHPGEQHPLTEACLSSLEKNLERERHPQTLFLLLSYYRLKWRSLQTQENASSANAASDPEQLLANRKILRLVKHTLASVSGVRDQEMALLDEMLAACAREVNNKSLELIFSSHLFYQNRQEKFIHSLAEELPKKVDAITPYTMALIAKYIARHRLRETQLLETIAEFLVKKAEFLDSKVIQKLVFPFSRMSYRPVAEQRFFSLLEEVLQLKALSSPLATVNILMSLFQLGHFPGPVLHRVFSSTFINNVINSPYALMVRRYLSLLDAAVELEYRQYQGPRLQDVHKVVMFDHALTADEVNRKYSYKGLVAEALRQLVGEQNYKQDQILAPGYYTDFLLLLDSSGRILPIAPRSLTVVPSPNVAAASKPDALVTVVTSEFQRLCPFALEEGGGADEQPGQVAEAVGGAAESRSFLPHHIRSTGMSLAPSGAPRSGADGAPLDYGQYYVPAAAEFYSGLAQEHSLESQDSSTLSSPPSDALAPPPDGMTPPSDTLAPPAGQGPAGSAAPDSLFQFSIGKILEDEGGAAAPENKEAELPTFYVQEAASPTQLQPSDQSKPNSLSPSEQRLIKRVIMSVNDKWHYCHNSEVLVGSRAMRDRHLRLLGYIILQLPYHELEKLSGIEEVKLYLQQKLREAELR